MTVLPLRALADRSLRIEGRQLRPVAGDHDFEHCLLPAVLLKGSTRELSFPGNRGAGVQRFSYGDLSRTDQHNVHRQRRFVFVAAFIDMAFIQQREQLANPCPAFPSEEFRLDAEAARTGVLIRIAHAFPAC